MAEETAVAQVTDPKQTPKQGTDPSMKSLLFDALAEDKVFSTIISKDKNEFFASMENPEMADLVHKALLEDDVFKTFIPADSTEWANIFKKKVETGTLSPESTDISEDSGTPSETGSDAVFTAPFDNANKAAAAAIAAAPQKEEPETVQGIQERVEKQMHLNFGQDQQDIIDDVQAQMDAGNLSEDEANIQLQSRVADAETAANEWYDAEVDAGFKKLEKQQEDIAANTPIVVPSLLGSLVGQPFKVKMAKDLSPLERGFMTGLAMADNIPENLGIVHSTIVANSSNEILDQLKDKDSNEKIGDYTVAQIREAAQGNKDKAIQTGVDNYKKSSAAMQRLQAGSTVPSSISEIGSIGDFYDFATNTIGQAAPQALAGVVALGVGVVAPPVGIPAMMAVAAGTVGLETGIIQMEMMDELQKAHGLSPKEILEQALMNPNAPILGGLAAGSLDIISLGMIGKATGLPQLGKKLIKDGVKKIAKDMTVKQIIAQGGKGLAMGALTEGITEPVQGIIETTAAAYGAEGVESPSIVSQIFSEKFATEALGGSVVGGLFAGSGKVAGLSFQNQFRMEAKRAKAKKVKLLATSIRAGKVKTAPAAAPAKIRAGSVMTITNKKGGETKLKMIDGKWKSKTKKGNWVAANSKQQEGLSAKYNEAAAAKNKPAPIVEPETPNVKIKKAVRDELKGGDFKKSEMFNFTEMVDLGYSLKDIKKTTPAKAQEIVENKIFNGDTIAAEKQARIDKNAKIKEDGKEKSTTKEKGAKTEKTSPEKGKPEKTDKKTIGVKNEKGTTTTSTGATKKGAGKKAAAGAAAKSVSKVAKVDKAATTEPKTTVPTTVPVAEPAKKPSLHSGDPNSIQTALSSSIKKGNRMAELMISSKEKNPEFFNKDGTVKKKGKSPELQALQALELQHNENKAEVAGLRDDFNNATGIKFEEAPAAPAAEALSTQSKIDDISLQIRQLEPALKNLIAGRIDRTHKKTPEAKAAREKARAMSNRVTELKQERKKLRTELGQKGKLEVELSNIDPNAKATQVGTPKKIGRGKDQAVETDYAFEAAGLKGTIKEITFKTQPSIFYAFDSEGRTTGAEESASAAVASFKGKQPRKVSQVGTPHLEITGAAPNDSNSKVISNLNTIPKVIRVEIGNRHKGDDSRQMKLFIDPKVSKKGNNLVTVAVSTRGKVTSIDKKTGKPNKKLTVTKDSALNGHPDIVQMLVSPEKAKVETAARLAAEVEVDTKNEDPLKSKNNLKAVAKKIRGAKIKVPKGVLRMSAGFDLVYNGALEIAALAVEGGATFHEALRAAIKHVRESDWYKAVPKDEKLLREQQVEDEITAMFNRAEIPMDRAKITRAAQQEEDRIYKENKDLRKDAAYWAIFKRRVKLATSAFRTQMFVDAINLRTNKLEREMLPFIVERTGIPKSLGRPDLEQAYDNRNKRKLDFIAKEVREEMKHVWKTTEKYKKSQDAEEVTDYITHIWDIKKNKLTDVVSHFTTKDKWNSPRYIETLMEGIDKFGLTPKMLDISDIISVRASAANNMAANNEFVENLKGAKVGGVKVILNTENAPPNWRKVDGVSAMQGLRVHPDFHEYLRPIFRKKISDSNTLRALEKANAFIKGSQLSLSFFHHAALFEAAVPTIGFRAFSAVVKESLARGSVALANKGRDSISEYLKNPSDNKNAFASAYALQNNYITMEAARHGLQLGSTIDGRVQEMEDVFSMIANGANEITSTVLGKTAGNVISAPLKGAELIVKANNVLLWDYLHDTLKLMAYEKLTSKMPKAINTPALIKKYKIEQAQFVNDSFGGQNFDVLGFSPKQLQTAKIALLSPDWTISTLRQAAPIIFAPLTSLAKTKGWKLTERALGKVMGKSLDGEKTFRRLSGAQFKETSKYRAKTAGKFWSKAAAIYGIFYGAWNAFNRKRDMEENPHLYSLKERTDWESLMMWRNTSGHITHVFDGRYADGSERYIREGKQFRELFEFFIDDTPELSASIGKPALKKLGGKAAPALQIAAKAFTGKSLSGFEDYDLKDKEGWAWTAAFAKTTAKSLSPFAFSALYRDDKEFHALDLVFPASKGMSVSKGIRLLKYYMVTGNEEMQVKVQQEAHRNNINIKDMYTAAISQFQAEATTEMYKDYDTVGKVYERLRSGTVTSAKEAAKLGAIAKKMELDIQEKKLGFTYLYLNMVKWMKLRVADGELSGDKLEDFTEFIAEKIKEADDTYDDLAKRHKEKKHNIEKNESQ